MDNQCLGSLFTIKLNSYYKNDRWWTSYSFPNFLSCSQTKPSFFLRWTPTFRFSHWELHLSWNWKSIQASVLSLQSRGHICCTEIFTQYSLPVRERSTIRATTAPAFTIWCNLIKFNAPSELLSAGGRESSVICVFVLDSTIKRR